MQAPEPPINSKMRNKREKDPGVETVRPMLNLSAPCVSGTLGTMPLSLTSEQILQGSHSSPFTDEANES